MVVRVATGRTTRGRRTITQNLSSRLQRAKKLVFKELWRKKKLAVFVSEVETLLLRKNLIQRFWWLSDYPHMIKMLRNFIVNPDGQLQVNGKRVTSNHLIPVVQHQMTKLNWKHIKLTPRTKMSVKRAVTVCSHDVALDILRGPLPPEDTVGTRTYLKQCYKLFKILNNNSEVDPACYKQLISIMIWV